jgi:hypothetical protein
MFAYIEDLLLFFLVIYIVKGVLRNLFPFFFKPTQTGSFRNSNGPFQNPGGSNPFGGSSTHGDPNVSPKPEGKIEVDYIPPKKDKKGGHFEGDFIDYEEIKK